MKAPQELIDLMEIAAFSQESQFAHLPRVHRAKWAVDEIKRLRAKVNRLIRVANAEYADGNRICDPRALLDLVLEEEI
jgi:hypothetical protein